MNTIQISFRYTRLNGTAGTRNSHETLIKTYDPIFYGQLDGFSNFLSLTLGFYEKVTLGDDEPYLQFGRTTIDVITSLT